MKTNVIIQAMRPLHWVKNLLLFLVPLTAHQTTGYTPVLLGFVSFCALASAVYVLNDLMDIEADRSHPQKRSRPVTSGALSRSAAGGLAIGLAVFAAGVAWIVGQKFAVFVGAYVLLNLAYTLIFKRVVILDVICLAAFYVLRIFAGGAIVGVASGEWFIAFCLFIFLSLAFLKRYVELAELFAESAATEVNGRGYRTGDLMVLQSSGLFAGMASVLVLSLYINSSEVRDLYPHKDYIWLIAPLVLYWITRVWFFAARGEVHHDPIVVAVHDRVSYVVALLIVAIAILAAR
ncbi:MAG: UbiA family prenyltransferase [Planctomycetaceae bacterium]